MQLTIIAGAMAEFPSVYFTKVSIAYIVLPALSSINFSASTEINESKWDSGT